MKILLAAIFLSSAVYAASLEDPRPILRVYNGPAFINMETRFFKRTIRYLKEGEPLLGCNNNLYYAYIGSKIIIKYADKSETPLDADDVQGFVQKIVDMPVRLPIKTRCIKKKLSHMMNIHTLGLEYLFEEKPIDDFANYIIERFMK